MVIINDKKYEFLANESLYSFLIRANFDPDFVALEIDSKLIRKKDYKDYILEDNSTIEAFSIVGGGWWKKETIF